MRWTAFGRWLALLTIALRPAGTVAQTVIHINGAASRGPISPALFGENLEYWCGPAVYDHFDDPDRRTLDPDLLELCRRIGVRSLRFPGGSQSDVYRWYEGIGPLDGPCGGEFGPEARPHRCDQRSPVDNPAEPGTQEAASTLGTDDFLRFAESLGAEPILTVNFGTGTAQEAAAWVAYCNGDDPEDTRPIGDGPDELGFDWGTVGQWVALRAANGHAEPYRVRYWEIGNEMYLDVFYLSWHRRAPAGGDADPVAYRDGGSREIADEPVGGYRSWATATTEADPRPRPGQRRFVRHPPVHPDSQRLLVDGAAWTEVDDLATAAAGATVYEFDDRLGMISFGDGAHGAIPLPGADITASYVSGPHSGLIAFSEAMKAVDPTIKVGNSFPFAPETFAGGGIEAQDFAIVHLYVNPGFAGDPSTNHLRAMGGSTLRGEWIGEARETLRSLYPADADRIEFVNSEYNLNPPAESVPRWFGISLDAGLSLADMLRLMIENDFSLATFFQLMSRGWTRWTTIWQDGETLIPEAPALVLQLFREHFGPEQVDASVSTPPYLTADELNTWWPNQHRTGYSFPALEALASRNAEGDTLYLVVINKDPAAPIAARIEVAGFVPEATAGAWEVNGPDWDAYNSPARPEQVRLAGPETIAAGSAFSYEFRAHSVTAIELRSTGSDADADADVDADTDGGPPLDGGDAADGSEEVEAAGGDAGADDAAAADPGDGPSGPAPSGGCSCAVLPRSRSPAALLVVLALLPLRAGRRTRTVMAGAVPARPRSGRSTPQYTPRNPSVGMTM